MAKSSVKDELNCSVCLNIFSDPVMLSCGHNFCRVCIGNVLDTQDGAGVYTCPECRAEFTERPVLQQNRTLNNIAQHFLSTQPIEQKESTIPCTYCDIDVPAVKTCVHCEASLCITHVKKHSKSVEHVLIEPTSSLENRKCPVHKEILKYHCTQDDVCICTSCWITGDHAGHQVEMLSEAAEKAKKKLRDEYVTLSSKTAVCEEEITRLQAHTRQTHDNATARKQKVDEMFGDLRRRLETLKIQAVSEINRVEKEDSDDVSKHIQQTRVNKTHLSLRMDYIQELCNTADPLAVLRGTKRAGFSIHVRGSDRTPSDDDDDKFQNSVRRQMRFERVDHLLANLRLKYGLYLQEAMDILLDVNTAANDVAISEDCKAASCVDKIIIRRPDRSVRFRYPQVMSNKGVFPQTTLQEATDILLDVNTAANDVAISKDCKAASCVDKIIIRRQDRSGRFRYPQVMSNKGVFPQTTLQEATDILLDVNTAANDVALSEDCKAASCVDKIIIRRQDRSGRFRYPQVMSNKGGFPRTTLLRSGDLHRIPGCRVGLPHH